LSNSHFKGRRATVVLIAISLLATGFRSIDHSGSRTRPTHPEGKITRTVPLRGRPHDVAIAPDGTFCVSLIDESQIACGRLADTRPTVEQFVPVGKTPVHVALDPDGRVAYTADQYGKTASIVDLDSGSVVGSVELADGGFSIVAIRRRAYVTTAEGTLYVIDATTRRTISQLKVARGGANGLAIDTLGSRLYVSSIDAGIVTEINTATNAKRRTFRVGRGAQRVALSPDRRTLYVASAQRGVESIDLVRGQVRSFSGVAPGAVGLAVSPDGARLYVTNPLSGLVTIIDPRARRVIDTLRELGTPRNVAFGRDGAMALVTNEQGSLIVIQ
jgi:YVTN family beta-propeller protein